MVLMLLPRFKYHAPSELKEACEILESLKDKARPFAGGTDIIVNMKKGLVSPETLISLKRILRLGSDAMAINKNSTKIGACITAADLMNNDHIIKNLKGLASAAGSLGTPLIRNSATIGGNLVTSRPAGDFSPPLMAYGAKVTLNSISGERSVLLKDFFLGPGRSIIKDDEILSEIVIDNPAPYSGCGYIKFGVRKTLEISIVNVAAFLTLEKPGGPIKDARIVLGAVAPVPMRSASAEHVLKGELPGEDLFISAGEAASQDSRPIDDFRASAAYRREMVKILTKRALHAALKDITNN